MSAFNQDSGAKLLEALKRGIENITLNVLNENPRDYHKRGRVISQDEWGWILSIDNATYTRVPSLERVADYKQGDVVEVMIPNGQPSNMFIMGRIGGVVSIATLDMVFPVGKVILTTDNVSPATYVPNTTWEKISDRFLVGAGNLYPTGATGGSKDAVVVEHNHPVNIDNNGLAPETVTVGSAATTVVGTTSAPTQVFAQTVGVDGTDKNLPPYLAVNIWKRVS